MPPPSHQCPTVVSKMGKLLLLVSNTVIAAIRLLFWCFSILSESRPRWGGQDMPVGGAPESRSSAVTPVPRQTHHLSVFKDQLQLSVVTRLSAS